MRARTGLCWISFLAGQSEACLVEAREAARFGRADDVETILTRARGYDFGGLHSRGAAHYRRAIELDPNNEEAHAFLVIANKDLLLFHHNLPLKRRWCYNADAVCIGIA